MEYKRIHSEFKPVMLNAVEKSDWRESEWIEEIIPQGRRSGNNFPRKIATKLRCCMSRVLLLLK
jgi:hypothetical protein